MTTAVAPYLDKLVALRDALADNLVEMGISATHAETLETLVPKVLEIVVGNDLDEILRATITALYPTASGNGIIPSNVAISFTPVINIAVLCRIAQVRIRLDAAGAFPNLDRLTIAAPGWTVTTETTGGEISAYVLTLSTTDADTRRSVRAAIDAIRVSNSGLAAATLTMAAIGSVQGATFTASGSCLLQFQLQNWDTVEAGLPTWADAEGLTWAEVEEITVNE